MNILSNDQMKEIEKVLLNSYQMTEHKLKFNILQLFEQSTKPQQILFKNVDNATKASIVKMVPLTKNLKSISLIEQQNSLFKVITYAFLLIIYKKQNKINQYLKDQIKCSLYSDDINLLDIRNHSFNKKMQNKTIKVLIAQFFKQFEYIIQSSFLKNKNFQIDEVLQSALQKNDLVLEGFHLFFRTILWKLQVQNAQNCIEEVNVQEAISNLVQYFDVNCRIFNNLYLLNDDGIFISQLANGNLAFGNYYENQSQFFQQIQETETVQKDAYLQIKNTNLNLGKIILKDNQIEGDDIKIFNFMMDTDRNSENQIQQANLVEKSPDSETPYFVSGQEFGFGKKSDRPKQSLDHSLAKISTNRFYNQHINQIQSQEQGYPIDESNQAPTPYLGSNNNFLFKEQKQNFSKVEQGQNSNAYSSNKMTVQKSFNFCIQSNQEYEQNENDQSPTPVLGGNPNTFFKFSKKESLQQKDSVSEMQNRGSSKHALTRTIHQIQQQNQKQAENIKKIDRRHSVQYNKVDNKGQMKTSKNQIKVIDQTASRTILLEDTNEQFQQFQERSPQNRRAITQKFFGFHKQNKGTVVNYDNMSIPSSCTCCLQKKDKMKMQSKLFQIQICPRHYASNNQFPNNNKVQSPTNKLNFFKVENENKRQKLQKQECLKVEQKRVFTQFNFKTSSKQNQKILFQSGQNLRTKNNTINDFKGENKIFIEQNVYRGIPQKVVTPQDNNKKRQEFIQFLKKDKKDLIKKITEKREVKVVQQQQSKQKGCQKNQIKISDKRIIKQSMFVEPYYIGQSNNPESRSKIQSFQNRINNRSVTPTKQVSKSPLGKMYKKQNKIGQIHNFNNIISHQITGKTPAQQSKYSLNDKPISFIKPKVPCRLQSQPTQTYQQFNTNNRYEQRINPQRQQIKNINLNNRTFTGQSSPAQILYILKQQHLKGLNISTTQTILQIKMGAKCIKDQNINFRDNHQQIIPSQIRQRLKTPEIETKYWYNRQ